MKRHLWLVGGIVFAAVIGCGAPPAQTPVAQPTRTPMITVPEEAVELVQAAREALAARLNQIDEAIDLIDLEPAEWPTAALGCPQPGMMYAQVITPGYIVRLKTDDNVYEVHVSKSGHVVFCDAEEESTRMVVPEAAKPAVMAARRDLASRANVEVEAVQVVEFEAVEWSDSSLGCPEPGKMYLQVITPGYRVVLQAAGQTYEYHTSRGNRAVLCQKGSSSQKQRLLEMRDVVERARDDLAQRLGIEPAAISVAAAVPVSELDQPAVCPEANQLAAPGVEYQLVLQAEGMTYIYRGRGETVVLCAQ
ncbi:MAG: hypothetical protein ACE5LU_03765 [Anaerolineae bacterium]